MDDGRDAAGEQSGLAIAPDGRAVATWGSAGMSVHAVDGTVRRLDPGGSTAVVAAVADRLWRVARDGEAWTIGAVGWDGHDHPVTALPDLGRAPRFATSATGIAALGATATFSIHHVDDGWSTEPLPHTGELVVLSPRMWIARKGLGLVLQRGQQTLPIAIPPELARRARLIGGGALLSGSHAALELATATDRHLAVIDLRSLQMVRRLRLEGASELVLVDRPGHAVILEEGIHVAIIDLLASRRVGEIDLTAPQGAIAVSANAATVAMLGRDGGVQVRGYRELTARRAISVVTDPPATAANDAEDVQLVPPPAPDARAPTPLPHLAIAAAQPDAAPMLDAPMLALRPRSPTAMRSVELDDYLADGCELVTSFVARARAHADDALEPARRTAIEQREHAAWAAFRRWNVPGTPHVDVAAELGLSPLATAALLVVAAPVMWGDLARAYGALANDRGRPLCDELLVGQLLGAGPRTRRDLARELDDDAALVRQGLVKLGAGRRPFRDLAITDAAIARLEGDDGSLVQRTGAIEVRDADVELAALRGASIARLVAALANPPGRTSAGARVVLRGRVGSGRRTLAAALARRSGRRLATIDAAAAGDGMLVDALRSNLLDAHVRGWLPCISGLDHVDPAIAARLRQALAQHPGPLVVRTGPGLSPPLEPGYLIHDLGRLDLAAREAMWSASLAARALSTAPAASLAARYEVGPGTAARVVASLGDRDPVADDQLQAHIETAISQHRETRIGAVAERVERLAHWEDLVLTDELHASISEFCARVRLRGQVLDRLGMGHVTTARGLTAMFQGAPGTGKTMVAGVIARELGFDLYRIDLSKVISKWIGETEKNLATVFEAAEDGKMILLFDEADSLFGKRTEVKSSNDRHANTEVNYLLQRLDSFEGVAILTTNFGASIDPAFKRRLSLRATFGHPDVEMRERLWIAHVHEGAARAAALGLPALARRYEMSGGYIRNAAIRAAYLAAGRGREIDAALLEEAVLAEYRDADRLLQGGPLH